MERLVNKKMVIGFDGNEANIEERVGVNVYAYDLLCAISKLLCKWPRKHKLIVYLKNKSLLDMPKETSCLKYKVIKGGGAWILRKLVPELLFGKSRPDIFFSPSHYLPPFTFMPGVCSIMDLGYLEFSGQFKKRDYWQLKVWSAISIYISKAVIAISNSTRKDIVRHYPFASKKIYLTYPAFDSKKFNTKIQEEDVRRIKKRYAIVGDYILFLSTLKPSKNLEGLFGAFSLIKEQFPRTKLVVTGKKGWLCDTIYKKVEELRLKDDVIFTGFIPEEDKPAIIKGARLFVLPSFWEGFGLDVLNALACGIPVVVSDAGSLPEVAGNAGVYVKPDDIKGMSDAIKMVLTMDKMEYNKLVEKGLEQVKKFSWEKTARETLRILESI